ncbi:Prp19/Pso4-like-domain-containing protein [Protomyces lactucae-debilis]|uniref:Pre-mRNA-processing factor 19 n=1 Tax=Protomyces lactucae-debilis TaxID=2754530 RepID=A0A1Y2FU63_PROLT|nr:Prp19/Pso4-like-domain-containing protein [Protomyces lactucae-debilis]ORY86235.1 Prp19/Pso4-like-domain-containing protein [Protomyces lactucae-debilis]
MFCAISGEAPQEPVISKVSGSIFERRLLEAYVTEHGTDPTTGEEMQIEQDILPVRVPSIAAPRPPSASSIPALLSLFQTEWDSLALETYGLKQSLHQTRQELSTALYQHDAACRVIARLTKERDEARHALAEVSQNLGTTNGAAAADEAMEDVEEANGSAEQQAESEDAVPAEIRSVVEAYQEKASAGRKKRKVPDDWTTAEALKEAAEAPVDEVAKACLVVPALAAAINKFGRAKNGRKKVALHPTEDFLVAAKADKFLLLKSEDLTEVFSAKVPSPILCATFHPDGHLLGLGCKDGNVYIYHLLSSTIEATFGPTAGPVTSLAFAENGFWLAVTCAKEKDASLWHLGKGTAIMQIPGVDAAQAVSFDGSAQFMAVAGHKGLKMLAYKKPEKTWEAVFEQSGHFEDVAWEGQGKGVVVESKQGFARYGI